MCPLICNFFNKNPKKILLLTYIFAISMIIILHAALTTITTRAHERETNILAEQLSKNPNFSEDDFQKLLADYPATKVVLYDKDLKQIYQNNENIISPTTDTRFMNYIAKFLLPTIDKDLKNAIDGQFFSQILWAAKLNNEDDKRSFMKVIAPISNHFNKNHRQLNKINGPIYGVLEVYYDISYDWRMYNNTRLFGIMLITIIFFVFYLLIDERDKKLNSVSNNIL